MSIQSRIAAKQRLLVLSLEDVAWQTNLSRTTIYRIMGNRGGNIDTSTYLRLLQWADDVPSDTVKVYPTEELPQVVSDLLLKDSAIPFEGKAILAQMFSAAYEGAIKCQTKFT